MTHPNQYPGKTFIPFEGDPDTTNLRTDTPSPAREGIATELRRPETDTPVTVKVTDMSGPDSRSEPDLGRNFEVRVESDFPTSYRGRIGRLSDEEVTIEYIELNNVSVYQDLVTNPDLYDQELGNVGKTVKRIEDLVRTAMLERRPDGRD